MTHYIDFCIHYLFKRTTNAQVAVAGNFNVFLTEAGIHSQLCESLFTFLDEVENVCDCEDWELQGCWIIEELVNPL